MKKLLVIIWLMFVFSAVGALFWYNEWVYHLPTPVPTNYKPVNTGKVIKLSGRLEADHSKPLVLLNDHAKVRFDQLALRAYGCSLPNCNK